MISRCAASVDWLDEAFFSGILRDAEMPGASLITIALMFRGDDFRMLAAGERYALFSAMVAARRSCDDGAAFDGLAGLAEHSSSSSLCRREFDASMTSARSKRYHFQRPLSKTHFVRRLQPRRARRLDDAEALPGRGLDAARLGFMTANAGEECRFSRSFSFTAPPKIGTTHAQADGRLPEFHRENLHPRTAAQQAVFEALSAMQMAHVAQH